MPICKGFTILSFGMVFGVKDEEVAERVEKTLCRWAALLSAQRRRWVRWSCRESAGMWSASCCDVMGNDYFVKTRSIGGGEG